MRDDLLPSSLSGFEICDVNRDGKDDILINLGIYGKAKPMDCFLCTEESDFIRMADFTELFIPVWKPASGTILDCGGSGDTYWMKRYKVIAPLQFERGGVVICYSSRYRAGIWACSRSPWG